MIENDIDRAIEERDPLVRLSQIVGAARRIDQLRKELASLKGFAAAACAEEGVTQRTMAEACDVTPMMVQQWVRRGREEAAVLNK